MNKGWHQIWGWDFSTLNSRVGGGGVIGVQLEQMKSQKKLLYFSRLKKKKYQFRRKILLKSRFYTNFQGYSFLESIGKIFFKDPSRVGGVSGATLARIQSRKIPTPNLMPALVEVPTRNIGRFLQLARNSYLLFAFFCI